MWPIVRDSRLMPMPRNIVRTIKKALTSYKGGSGSYIHSASSRDLNYRVIKKTPTEEQVHFAICRRHQERKQHTHDADEFSMLMPAQAFHSGSIEQRDLDRTSQQPRGASLPVRRDLPLQQSWYRTRHNSQLSAFGQILLCILPFQLTFNLTSISCIAKRKNFRRDWIDHAQPSIQTVLESVRPTI